MEYLTFFLVVTIDFTFFTALFVAAFQSKPKLSRLQNILIIFLYFIIDLIAEFVVQYYISPFFSHYLIYVAVKMAIFSVLYSLITSASVKKVLFVFLLSQQSIDCAKAFMTMYRSFFEDSRLRIINYYIVYFFIFASMGTVIYFIIKYFMRPLVAQCRGWSFWNYLWTIPALFCLVYETAIYPQYRNTGINFYPGGIYEFITPIAWFISINICIVIVLQSLNKTIEETNLNESLLVADARIDMQAEMYNKIRSNIDEARRERHDLRHHLIAIESYISQNDYDGAQLYIQQLIGTMGKESVAILCENYAVASITNHYMQLCIKNQIEFKADLNIPRKLLIPDNELCIIVGNLIENAYEACMKQQSSDKKISFMARMSGKNILSITVKNTYEGEIKKDAQNDILSSKHSGMGIGTDSVRNVAEKYNGMAKFEYTSKEFKASVFLNPIQQEEKQTENI